MGTAVIDTVSPFTILDPSVASGNSTTRQRVSLTLYSDSVPRAEFGSIDSIVTEICDDVSPCAVSSSGGSTPVVGLIGADTMSRASLRLDFPSQEMFFFPDFAGSAADLTEICDSVFANPFAGGGTVRIAGDDVSYVGLRPAIGVCMDAPAPDKTTPHGVDGLLLLSTATEASILSETAYQRLVDQTGGPPLASLPDGNVMLASGLLTGKVGTIGSLALVAEQSDRRGPCRELYVNRVMAANGCSGTNRVTPCPCENNDTFCTAGSAIDIDSQIQVLIVDDRTPFLQALRDEISPAFPEVDGLLGTNALQSLRIDLDYPNGRIIFSCRGPDCVSRPQVRSRSGISQNAACAGN